MSKLNFKLAGKQKKLLLAATAGVLVVAIGGGIVFGLRGSGDPVGVYPFSMVGMTEFWGDNQESYGPVTTDRIQTVYLSDTQTITEVKVAQGDTVKKGDVLMTYDTTLSELQLERKRLDVEKANLLVKEAKEELARINAMKPMGNTDVTVPVVEEDYGNKLESAHDIRSPKVDGLDDKQIGKSEDIPVICWALGKTELDSSLLNAVYNKVRAYNATQPSEGDSSSASALPEDSQEVIPDQNENTKPEEKPKPAENPKPEEKPKTEENQTTEKPKSDEPKKQDDTQKSEEKQKTDTENPPQTVSYSISFREKTASGIWAEVGSEAASCRVGDVLSSENVGSQRLWSNKNYHFQYFSVNGEQQSSVTVQAGQSISAVYTYVLKPSISEISCPKIVDGKVIVKQGDTVSLPFSFTVDNDDNPKGKVHWTCRSEDRQLTGVEAGRSYFLYGTADEVVEREYSITATYSSADGTSYTTKPRVFKLIVTENAEEKPSIGDFYMVLRVTKDDLQYAPYVTWQGIHVTVYGDSANPSFGMQFYDVDAGIDPFAKEATATPLPDIDYGSGLTAAEIAKLRKEQEKKIKELTASAKMTESEYNLMEREFNDGHIVATLDGEVVSVLSEEEARENRQPIMKVSGGGGFFVQGSVSELAKDTLKPGQEVSINDWNTGMMYTGQVESIGDFPVQENGWNGVGNPNASYYPFRVFIDGSADLQEGSYVSVTYSAAEAENGIYLENPFLRTEGGESYVYVRGKNGRLEKRTVTTGKSLWGSYTEIRSGLTEDDYVAFPYGKGVKPGAATEESDLSALYGY